jgi:hypothetical protein
MPVSLLANNFSEQYKEKVKKLRILKVHLGKKKYGTFMNKINLETKKKKK